jgi:hypothetical protein
MTEVRIDRLSATATEWPEPEEVPQMLRHIAADRLGNALRENPLPSGDWYVRRIDVAAELDPERPLSALETDWADRIVTALRVSLRDGSSNVVRYVRPEAAVDDLLAGLATARFEHVWAWQQVGLLKAGDPEPHSDAAAVCLLVLGRLPHGRVAALARLVDGVGVPALHRLLGTRGWVTAAALVAAESGVSWTPSREPRPVEDLASQDLADPEVMDRPLAQALAASIVATGGLATAFRGSSLRPDAQALQAWAMLAIAAMDPSLLRRESRLTLLVEEVGRRLRPVATPGLATGRASAPPGLPGTRRPATIPVTTGSGHDPAPVQGRSIAHPDPASRPGAQDPTRVDASATARTEMESSLNEPSQDPVTDAGFEGATSRWGGLLFLLNSAAGAGLPDLLDAPPFLTRPTPWVMRELGLALVPAALDDPVLMAFAGAPAGPPQQPPDKAERRAIRKCARSWAAATARRLGRDEAGDESDAELVQRISRRFAVIAQEPGWVEVGLRLDEVDVAVRSAGLDVDPGWVWWLGHVVRFRYE